MKNKAIANLKRCYKQTELKYRRIWTSTNKNENQLHGLVIL